MSTNNRPKHAPLDMFVRVSIPARVISTEGMSSVNPVGSVVTLTRDSRHLDGMIATDKQCTWGAVGENYELLDDTEGVVSANYERLED